MNNRLSFKNFNIIGMLASLLAFLFAFMPFYSVSPSESFVKLAGVDERSLKTFTIEKNLVEMNMFGVLFAIVVLIDLVVLIWAIKGSSKVDSLAIGLSVLAFILLLFTIMIGNADIENATSEFELFKRFSGTSADSLETDYLEGLHLEVVAIIFMMTSYWIKEIIINKYILKYSNIVVNPFVAFSEASDRRHKDSLRGVIASIPAEQETQNEAQEPQIDEQAMQEYVEEETVEADATLNDNE